MDKETKLNKRAENGMFNTVKNSDTESELDQSYINYKSQSRKKQREADSEMLSALDIDNEDRYKELKSDFLKQDIENDNLVYLDKNGVVKYYKEEAVDDRVDYKDINYSNDAIEDAKFWSDSSMIAIIYPTENLEELEELWYNYNSMIRKHQRESDWKSEELFGINNQTHYNYLKSKFLAKDIEPNDDDSIGNTSTDSGIVTYKELPQLEIEIECKDYRNDNFISLAEKCISLASRPNKSHYEDAVITNYIDNSIEYFNNHIAQSTELPVNDLPFFDPDSMISLGVYGYKSSGNYYSNNPDNLFVSEEDGFTSKKWFESYKNITNGALDKNYVKYSAKRIAKLNELYMDYYSILDSKDEEKIKARKQSILELGWNPEIKFNVVNRSAVDRVCKDVIYYGVENIKVINATKSISSIKESKEKNSSKEYIYLAAIINNRNTLDLFVSFDSEFKDSYRYDTNNQELLKSTPLSYRQDTLMQVYGITLNLKDISTIRQSIDKYSAEPNNEYIIDKLDTLTDFDIRLIGSNFIYKLLGKVGIKKFIYKLYQGQISNYKPERLDSFMDSITTFKDSNPLAEAASVDTNVVVNEIYNNMDDLSTIKVLVENNDQYLNNDIRKIYNNIIKILYPEK